MVGNGDFYLGWQQAKELHMEKYLLEFKIRQKNEIETEKNSFWKESPPVVKIRELVSYLLNDDNIT